MKQLFLLIYGITLQFFCIGQALNNTPLASAVSDTGEAFFTVTRTAEIINLDGNLSEAAWTLGKPAKDFHQFFPSDSIQAQQKTEIHMVYDDQYLYVGIKCYSIGENYIVPSLRRDYRAGGNDNISLLFDTFDDKTNAFLFGINPFGVRREALISNGGSELKDFAPSWDNKWQGEAQIHDGYWSAEMAIPFKTLRFEKGTKLWRFNCYRFDTQGNEQSVWQGIPNNQWIFNLAFSGKMRWDEPLQKAGTNFVVIPYVSANTSQDFEVVDSKPNNNFEAGVDAKIAVSSGLNLDLTVNPDFSQVEVDRQVTDLSRFEIFFPERRQFFLENADLFSSFGKSRVNPFFSRRIGIAQDTADNNISSRILYGARLSGKLNENWRIGLLNMQTAKDEDNEVPAFNYTVATLQRKVFNRSNIGLIFVNKDATSDLENDNYAPYNRVLAIDYNIANADNSWEGKIYYQQAFTPEDVDEKYAHGVELTYKKKAYSVEWLHQLVGENYDAEVGFVPRKDFFRIKPQVRTYFYPTAGLLTQHGFGAEFEMFFQPGLDIGKTDQAIKLFWDFQMRNTARGRITLQQEYTYLFKDFDPTKIQSDSTALLFTGTDYNYFSFVGSFNSDRRKLISFRAVPRIGQFYDGFRAGMNTNISMRLQPRANISLQLSYNYLKLDAPFEPVSLFLIGPRFDLTFSKQLFLTAFFQYNNQIDNFNVNARLQWRFAPVSDMFLVYTDNYGTDIWGKKNRALVFKVTYWLNL
ncbi:MAG: hypothetical protein ACI9XO_003406 [Paraglaciecola sp.]|jgi:hypothetical protein